MPAEADDPVLDLADSKTFPSAMGMLAYLAVDRADVHHEVNALSRCLKTPRQSSRQRLRRLARYLRGAADAEVTMVQPEFDDDHAWLDIWSDSGWAGDRQSRQSQSSAHIEIGGWPI